MKAIDFVVRDGAGALNRGVVPGEAQTTTIQVTSGQEISLNLRQVDMQGHSRSGDDLSIVLSDGRVIIVENYFNDAGASNRLFVSADGYLNEVAFVETTDGGLYAQFGPTEQWGKWSPSDDLIYLGRTEVAVGPVADDEVSMLAPFALLGGGGLGAAGVAAGVAGVAVAGGGVPVRATPAVDEPDSSATIGGTEMPHEANVSGTGEPGDTVTVVVGDQTQTTTIGDDGTWSVIFTGDNLPSDGTSQAQVTVEGGGETFDLSGPTFLIDTTPPEIFITRGAESNGDLFNEFDNDSGVSVGGTGEVGATLTVTVAGNAQTTTVGEDGNWSVTWPVGTFAPGEYTETMTIVATDALGNSATYTDALVIDTIAEIEINTSIVGGDGTVNAAEAAGGITLTGTAQSGSSVDVTFGGQTLAATIDANGNWSVDFPASSVLPGEYDATVTAVATDANGNSSTATGSFAVDTVTDVSINTSAAGGDGTINAAEAAAGITLTGTAQAGSSVQVTFGNTTLPATVDANGNWSVAFPSSAVLPGEYDATVTAVATDAAGNTATSTGTVAVDTISDVSVNTSTVGGDGTVNGVEAAAGITLTGSTQAGSSVQVTFGSTTLPAVVDANGNWSVDFPPSAVVAGEYDATVTAVATDASGNSSTATGTVAVDTYVNSLNYTSTAGGTDGVINAAEAQAGLVVTGQAEAGSTVTVTLGGATSTAVVAGNGSWTATFSSGQIPAGTYTSTMTATATDAAGNTADITQTVQVDTEAGLLTISPNPVEADDVINAAEASDGVVLSGTADPHAVVTVTMGGVSHTVVTGANGVWNATYAAGEIAPGTYTASIEATTTDAAGNTRTASDSVQVDTQVDNMSVSANPVGGDGVINATERGQGVTITGTTEVGSTVIVSLGGVSAQATVDAAGNWTVPFNTNQILTGEQNVALQITATDVAGNVKTISDTVEIDTLVNTLNFSAGNVAGDDVVNGAEAREGISLSGNVEPGSTVLVDFHGTTLTATVTASGNWSLDVPASAIPAGSYDADITVMATDAHNNMATISDTLRIDTDAPEGPVMASLTTIGDGVRGISIEQTDADVSVSQVNGNTISEISAQSADNSFGETEFRFGSDVPDGSNLVVTATDDAGNTSGTFVVLDDGVSGSTTALDAPGLGNFQIETIDMNFSEEAHLTINEAQLVNLSEGTDTLLVKGGRDDQVTLSGGAVSGTTTIDGADYNIYTVGAGTVMIDDDITVNTVIG